MSERPWDQRRERLAPNGAPPAGTLPTVQYDMLSPAHCFTTPSHAQIRPTAAGGTNVPACADQRPDPLFTRPGKPWTNARTAENGAESDNGAENDKGVPRPRAL